MKKAMKRHVVGQLKKSGPRRSIAGLGLALCVVVGLLWMPFHNGGLTGLASARERRESMSVAHSSLEQAEVKPSVPMVASTGLETATFALG